MIDNSAKILIGKSNSNEILGYPSGTLRCERTKIGGGIAGAPQQIIVFVKSTGWPEDLYERREFPQIKRGFHYEVYEEDGTIKKFPERNR